MPGTLRMGSASTKRAMAAWSFGISYCPSGFLMSEATLASSLFAPIPQEHVTCTSSLTRLLIASATASPMTKS